MNRKLKKLLSLALVLILMLGFAPGTSVLAATGVWAEGKVYLVGQTYEFPSSGSELVCLESANPESITPDSGTTDVSASIAANGSITLRYNYGYETTTFDLPSGSNAWKIERHIMLCFYSVTAYTVTFNTNGGGSVAAQVVASGDKATKPSDPTRTGYVFGGWYTDSGLTSAFDFNTAITADKTLYAKWIQGFTVGFNTNGGGSVASQTVASGDKATKPSDPTKRGYTFGGWYTDSGLTSAFDFNTAITENKTLYAKWIVNQYTITFDTDGGSAVAPITQDYGTAVTAPAEPAKTGYTFAGWDQTIPETVPAENLTITARWTPNRYTITFDTDGGSAVAPITQDYGTAVTAPAEPAKTGYTFAGWDPAIPETVPAEDRTLKARWTINRYTITFDTDGGSAVAPITQDYATAVTAPLDPTRPDYTFAGWDQPIPETIPAEDLTITAKWIPVVESKVELSGAVAQSMTINGLEQLAETSSGGNPVSLTMSVETKTAGAAANAGQITALARAEHPFQTLEFLEINVEKRVLNNTEAMLETGAVLEIIIPYDFGGKEYVTLYRCHDGRVEKLVESASGEDGTYQKDEAGGVLTVYASKFSTYAIGYTQYYQINGTVACGSFTGDVTVSLLEDEEEEPGHTATVAMTDGVGAYSFTHVLAGEYTLRAEWVEKEKPIKLDKVLLVSESKE